MHSFRVYHIQSSQDDAEEDQSADIVAKMWTTAGILLCLLIFVYLAIAAQRAVDREPDDEPTTPGENTEALIIKYLENITEYQMILPWHSETEYDARVSMPVVEFVHIVGNCLNRVRVFVLKSAKKALVSSWTPL
jgi:hypothetical protein